MSQPSVAIVILNWNRIQLVRECLASLSCCTYPAFRVIIVDNGSGNNEAERIREEFPEVIVSAQKKNLGFAEGNNVGMRIALEKGFDYCLLLNNDTVVDPGFIEPLVQAMETDKSVGAVSPLIFFYDPPDMIWFAGGGPILLGVHEKRPYFRAREKDFPYDRAYETEALSGCAFMTSREHIKNVGLLDPVFFCYCEDTDYSHRFHNAGLKMKIIPESRIWHKVSVSGGGANNPLSLYLMGRGRVILLKKHSPVLSWLIFFPFCLGQLMMDFRRGGSRSVKARLRGYLHGFTQKLDTAGYM